MKIASTYGNSRSNKLLRSAFIVFFPLLALTACNGGSTTTNATNPVPISSPTNPSTGTGGGTTVTYNLTTSIVAGSGTLSKNSAGTSCGTNCSTYNSGTLVTITATPASGYQFTSWSGCDSTSGSACNVTLSNNRTVSATFSAVAASNYTLNVSKTGTGTVTSSPSGINCGATCSSSYTSGTSVTLTAAPGTGYQFTSWSGCASSSGTSCTVSMSANRTVSATFSAVAPSSYTLSVTKIGSGTVTSSPSGINCGATCSGSFASGASVTLSAVAASGYQFASWSGSGVSCPGTGSCTVSMTAARSVLATFTSTSASADVCNGLVTDKAGHSMTALTRPALFQAVTDPEFGTTIRRITDVRNDGRGSNSVLKPVYSTVSAWNADESYLILYRTVGAGGGHELFNGKTYAFIRKLDDIDPADLEQIYWDTKDPDILYYVNITTRQMIRYHISTRAKDVVHDFSGICPGDLTGGTDPMFTSWDSGKIGLVCPGSSKIFSYNIATNTVNTQLTLATGFNAPQAAPSGTRYFLNENDGPGTVRDDNMNVLLVLDMATAQEHGAMSMLSNGTDTMNAVAFDKGPRGSGIGTLVQHDMVTGAARVIVGPDTGYPYPPSGTHISGMAFKRPGLMAVSVKGNLNGANLLDSELLLVDTDPATNPTGKVCRIGHHRTASDDYWAEPHVVISPSGTRVLFGSSWGNTGVIVDSYVVELPTYTP